MTTSEGGDDDVIHYLNSLKVRRGPPPSHDWEANETNRQQIDSIRELIRVKIDIPNTQYQRVAADVAFYNFVVMASLVNDSAKNYTMAMVVLSDIEKGYRDYQSRRLTKSQDTAHQSTMSDASCRTVPIDAGTAVVHHNGILRSGLRLMAEIAVPIVVIACGYLVGTIVISGLQ